MKIFIHVLRDSLSHSFFCDFQFQLLEFEKWLRKMRLSDEFEKEFKQRKKDEKKMRKHDSSKDQNTTERIKSLRVQNQQNNDSSNRYV